MAELIGWFAMAIFALSYFVRRREHMLAIQIGAATVWIAYGALLGARPVVVANAIVACAALVSIWRTRARGISREA
jgi:hypothetical protein